MKKSVKMLSLFLAAILIAACLFGCGAKTSTDSQVQSQFTKFSKIETNENDNQVEDSEGDALNTENANTDSVSVGGDFSKHTYQIGTKGMEVTIETDLSQYIYSEEPGEMAIFHIADLAADLGWESTSISNHWRYNSSSRFTILDLSFADSLGEISTGFRITSGTLDLPVAEDVNREIIGFDVLSGDYGYYCLEEGGVSCTYDYAPFLCYVMENADTWNNDNSASLDADLHCAFFNDILKYYDFNGWGITID